MYLGIEIGGTKLQLGLGRGDGVVSHLLRCDVVPAAGGDGIREQITTALPTLLFDSHVDRSDLRGVGVGFGGPVDDMARSVIKSHQIVGWDGFPLATWLEELLGLPCALGNDADVAGLAEALFGAGRGMSPVFYMTIGSGIGGGLILDQRIVRGCGRGAAEIGHVKVWDGSGWHILEDVAAGWGMERRARVLGREWSAREIGALVGTDPLADRIFGDATDALAQTLCHVIALVCPRRIVIGGGVSLMGEALFGPLRAKVAERVFAPFAGLTEIVPAALGEAVVVHGALALARQRLSER